MSATGKLALMMVLMLVLALPLVVACGNGGNKPESDISTETSEEARVITIGNLTDKTGVSSTALNVITMALEDMAAYYNEQNLIPGIKLKVISYDGGYDPSKNIPGYEWLREKGADLIFDPVPESVETLKDRCNNDQMVIFGMTASREGFLPPGYTFCESALSDHLAYTLLKWIAGNDPDFPKDRPAKIGAAGWTSALLEDYMDGIKAYAEAHPDQYQWVGGFVRDFGFSWTTEVPLLKDCDYVYPPMAPIATFTREFRDAGYKAKFIGGDPHVAFLNTIRDARLWDELDGMLFIKECRWWNEDGELVNLTKELLQKNHPGSATEIMQDGVGYFATLNVWIMLEIIKGAVENVGAENFDSQALYDAAESTVLEIDGVQYSFSPKKRFAPDHVGIYQLRADGQDLFRADPECLPLRTSP
ncbi:MAG: ABC transporter substrate-binding protein [Chloroflexi bacterium]|nr:ABC transporter substrate-binding protein [Chloroflexota bacterium]